jgi:hypothetical protein
LHLSPKPFTFQELIDKLVFIMNYT